MGDPFRISKLFSLFYSTASRTQASIKSSRRALKSTFPQVQGGLSGYSGCLSEAISATADFMPK